MMIEEGATSLTVRQQDVALPIEVRLLSSPPIEGLRSDSLYAKAYYALRQPLIDMMFDGVAWDSASAEKEKQRLEEQKGEIKRELDRLTGGVRLYAVYKRKSRLLRDLLAEQRTARDARKSVGARTEQGKQIGAAIDNRQACIRQVRASDSAAWEYTFGDYISNDKLGQYLYGRGDNELGLPEARLWRKGSGKRTVTVGDLALQKLGQRFALKSLPAGGVLMDLLQAVRRYRRCEKLVSTYLNPAKLLSPVDGRFHSQYNPHGTQTGRLSGTSDPWGYGGNPQNIDREYKWLFLPD